MLLLERYLLALMTFVFGWALFWIPAVWVKRGDFMSGDRVISRSSDPTTFWAWVAPAWTIGALLMGFGVFLGVRYSRRPADALPKISGSRPLLWFVALWFVFGFVGLVVQYVRA